MTCFLLTQGHRTGWARYMEWAHNVEIRWTNKNAWAATGVAEAAATL